jgi:hypothetical protein
MLGPAQRSNLLTFILNDRFKKIGNAPPYFWTANARESNGNADAFPGA